MAFQKKEWKDHSSTYPNRIQVTNVDDDTDIQKLTVTRAGAEGIVTEQGTPFSAQKMNDLEDRLETAFTQAQTLLSTILDRIYPVGSVFITVNNDLDTVAKMKARFGQHTNWQLLSRYLMPVTVESGAAGSNFGNNVDPKNPTIIRSLPQSTWSVPVNIQPALAELHYHFHYYNDQDWTWGGYGATGRPYHTPQPYQETRNGTTYTYNEIPTANTFAGCGSTDAEITNRTTEYGGNPQQTHTHTFGDNNYGRGVITGRPVTIDISQPYRTVYAWRRLNNV